MTKADLTKTRDPKKARVKEKQIAKALYGTEWTSQGSEECWDALMMLGTSRGRGFVGKCGPFVREREGCRRGRIVVVSWKGTSFEKWEMMMMSLWPPVHPLVALDHILDALLGELFMFVPIACD